MIYGRGSVVHDRLLLCSTLEGYSWCPLVQIHVAMAGAGEKQAVSDRLFGGFQNKVALVTGEQEGSLLQV